MIMFQTPPLQKDKWWDVRVCELPHTKASFEVRDPVPKFRLSGFKVQETEIHVPDVRKRKNSKILNSHENAVNIDDEEDERGCVTSRFLRREKCLTWWAHMSIPPPPPHKSHVRQIRVLYGSKIAHGFYAPSIFLPLLRNVKL